MFVLFFFAISFAYSQDTTKTRSKLSKSSDFWEKAYFGGNLGLQFGAITLVDISPLIGYQITDRLSIGVGGTYLYYRIQSQFYRADLSIYGARAFARFFVIQNLFAHAEYEVLNGPWDNNFSKSRFNITNVLVGGGYRQQVGSRAFINMMILWNINESVYSPYQNPIIRGGVSFGI